MKFLPISDTGVCRLPAIPWFLRVPTLPWGIGLPAILWCRDVCLSHDAGTSGYPVRHTLPAILYCSKIPAIPWCTGFRLSHAAPASQWRLWEQLPMRKARHSSPKGGRTPDTSDRPRLAGLPLSVASSNASVGKPSSDGNRYVSTFSVYLFLSLFPSVCVPVYVSLSSSLSVSLSRPVLWVWVCECE